MSTLAVSGGGGIIASIAPLVITILVAIFASVTAPLILAYRTERMHREDRQADYARQDEVAERAASASTALLKEQRLIASGTKEANGKLDHLDLQTKRIHTLVNSDMTAARQSELDQTRAMAAVLRRVIAVATAAKEQEPDPADVEALERAEKRIEELRAILADRLHQAREVEAEQEKNPIEDNGDE